LYAALMSDPRRPVSAGDIAAIADADARENWAFMLAFRDHLLRHETLEAAYIDLARNGAGNIPPIFINQLAHVVLRNALDGCEDPYVLRAAELFFRPQRLTLHDGSLIAADEETISGTGATPASPLVSMLGIPAQADIDVLNDDNADHYLEHSDLFHTAIDLTAGRRGLDALADALRRWVSHLLAIDVTIVPLTEMRDVNLVWYAGLDAEATRIGNALWNGDDIDDATRARVVGLFRLIFNDPAIVIDRVGQEPVYLILAMSQDKVVRMKPQNLITGLPIRMPEAVS
jgi:hypothetical protein